LPQQLYYLYIDKIVLLNKVTGVMIDQYQREITGLASEDTFLVLDRMKTAFDYPIHFHPELELNFIRNGKGMQRTIGFSLEEIDDYELVLVGSNVYHGWKMHRCSGKIHEITIQFHPDLFSPEFLRRSIMKPLRELLENSKRGILFDKAAVKKLAPRIIEVSKLNGIEVYLELFSILYELSKSVNQRLLSEANLVQNDFENSDKTKLFYDYVHKNYSNKITLEDMAELMSMSKVTFNRFVKKTTERTFITFLNGIRVDNASRMLAEEDFGVSEIAYKCGFYNIANFNRIFKKIKGCTPSQYRKEFQLLTRVF